MNLLEAVKKVLEWYTEDSSDNVARRAVMYDLKEAYEAAQQDESPLQTCEFRDCRNEAQYEGWYRVLDFAGQPSGLIQNMRVCKDCVKFLVEYTPASGEERMRR